MAAALDTGKGARGAGVGLVRGVLTATRGVRDLDLLVVGEINPDIVVTDPDPVPVFGQAERLVEGIRLTIGSSSAITACGAARLGLRVAIVGVVGDDALGRFTLDALAARGVDVSACRIAASALSRSSTTASSAASAAMKA